ncbi:MAG: uracil-xanthine permease, partial [Christensenellaceae bacterium]|nr:uracil-xanthine permease [Christensenellaceae bacterium]
MNLIYDVGDKPKFKANLVFAIQQVLAIIAATLLVPTLVNLEYGEQVMSQAAALFGAGAGTLIYILFTRKKSPVFLGSSFAFISPLIGACAFGYLGIFLGAVFAGLVYVVIATVVRFVGTKWVDKLMPPVIIGPTVALIGLSLCSSAVNNLNNTAASPENYNLVAIFCGLVAFFTIVFASVRGNKTMKLIPFIMGVLVGYAVAAIFTAIGSAAGIEYLQIIDFTPLVDNFKDLSFASFFSLPDFTFVGAIGEGASKLGGGEGIAQIALYFVPVAFVVFAEHIAD